MKFLEVVLIGIALIHISLSFLVNLFNGSGDSEFGFKKSIYLLLTAIAILLTMIAIHIFIYS